MTNTSIENPRVDAVMEQLRRAGGRVTPARRLVVSALLDSTSHQTAEDIATAVRRADPEVHLSTVYRSLESLESFGLLEHTHVGHGPAVYHLGAPHQHLVCEQCGTLIDINASTLDALSDELRARFGFRLHVGHFAILGRCGACGP